jgi:hypothetical protein
LLLSRGVGVEVRLYVGRYGWAHVVLYVDLCFEQKPPIHPGKLEGFFVRAVRLARELCSRPAV